MDDNNKDNKKTGLEKYGYRSLLRERERASNQESELSKAFREEWEAEKAKVLGGEENLKEKYYKHKVQKGESFWAIARLYYPKYDSNELRSLRHIKYKVENIIEANRAFKGRRPEDINLYAGLLVNIPIDSDFVDPSRSKYPNSDKSIDLNKSLEVDGLDRQRTLSNRNIDERRKLNKPLPSSIAVKKPSPEETLEFLQKIADSQAKRMTSGGGIVFLRVAKTLSGEPIVALRRAEPGAKIWHVEIDALLLYFKSTGLRQAKINSKKFVYRAQTLLITLKKTLISIDTEKDVSRKLGLPEKDRQKLNLNITDAFVSELSNNTSVIAGITIINIDMSEVPIKDLPKPHDFSKDENFRNEDIVFPKNTRELFSDYTKVRDTNYYLSGRNTSVDMSRAVFLAKKIDGKIYHRVYLGVGKVISGKFVRNKYQEDND